MSAEESARLEAWLEAPENAAAFEKARQVWNMLGDADMQQRRAMEDGAPGRRRWAWPAAGGLAAALALAGAIAIGLSVTRGAPEGAGPDLARLGEPDYATAVGERLSVALPDGSTVTLNTNSSLDVVYTEEVRVVRLLQGQAFFDVASEPERSFVVEAADRRITAHGTAFDVRLDPGRFQVLLVEGSVGVHRSPYSRGGGAQSEEIFLEPGQGLIATLGGPEQVSDANIDRELRWREGFVEFDDEPLASAVAEMNRYTTAPLLVRDSRVADLRLSGVFRVGQRGRFVQVVSSILPVGTQDTAGGATELVWAPPE